MNDSYYRIVFDNEGKTPHYLDGKDFTLLESDGIILEGCQRKFSSANWKWLQSNLNNLKFKELQFHHFNFENCSEFGDVFFAVEELEFYSCTGILEILPVLIECTAPFQSLKTISFDGYMGGDSIMTMEEKKLLVKILDPVYSVTSLNFGYDNTEFGVRNSSLCDKENEQLNNLLIRNLAAQKNARISILTFLLGNAYSEESTCYCFPKEIALMISKHAFSDFQKWRCDQETAQKLFAESHLLRSKEDKLETFIDSSVYIPKLENYRQDRKGVEELTISFDPERLDISDFLNVCHYYQISNFCYYAETEVLNFKNVDFRSLSHAGGCNPGETIDSFPALFKRYQNDIKDNRYPLWKVKKINIINCKNIGFYLKLLNSYLNAKGVDLYTGVNPWILNQKRGDYSNELQSLSITINGEEETMHIVVL